MENDRIKKVLFNEVSFTVAIIAAVVAVVGYLNSPAQKNSEEITILKQQVIAERERGDILSKQLFNDIHTIEENIKALRIQGDEQSRTLVRLETLLNERLPKK